jgi:hypothetical protein
LTATAEILRNLFGLEDESVRRNGVAAETDSGPASSKSSERLQSSSADQEVEAVKHKVGK